jgi:signal transduction histidine kinase
MERKRAEREHARYADQLQTLKQLLVEARQDERRRLAQELHDRVGQNLTALDLNLNVIRGALPSNVPLLVNERLGECLRLIDHTVQIVSDVMAGLHSALPDDAGLLAALRWQAEQFCRRTGVPVQVIGQEPTAPPRAAVQYALLRIAQEALINAVKHARGSTVCLMLESSAERVRMIVADDGCGFDSSAISPCRAHSGWGLRIMRERADAVGASLEVESQPGTGTQVIVEVRR